MPIFVESYRHVAIFAADDGTFFAKRSGRATTIEEMRGLIDIKLREMDLEGAVNKGRALFHDGKTALDLKQEAVDHARVRAIIRGGNPDEAAEDAEYLMCLQQGFTRAYNAKHGYIDA
jgi:hypothetical protein